MIVRGIDAEGNWLFGKGANDYLQANAAIGQNIKTRLQSFLGDCFFAINEGLDWFNILGSKNQIGLELAIRAVILNTPLVTAIRSLTVLVESNRNARFTYSVDTIYTQTNPNAVVESNANLILTEDGDAIVTEDGDPITGG